MKHHRRPPGAATSQTFTLPQPFPNAIDAVLISWTSNLTGSIMNYEAHPVSGSKDQFIVTTETTNTNPLTWTFTVVAFGH